jgi:lipopolysaccharide export LptBFGC system permease protein LptF
LRTLLRRLLLAIAALAVASCELPPAYPTADLVIAPDGALSLDGKPVAEQDLVRELKAVRDREPDTMLNIRTDRTQHDRPPVHDLVDKAVQAAGIVSTNRTEYKERERARRWKGRLFDLVYFGGVVLFTALAAAAFTRNAKTPSAAKLHALGGALLGGLVAAVLIGLFLNFHQGRMHIAFGKWSTNSLLALLYTLPCSVVGGVMAGTWRARQLRQRPKAAS